MSNQLDIFEPIPDHDYDIEESQKYLTTQLITYLGNKRSLLNFIGLGIALVQEKLNKKKLSTFDVFSGSGVVSRYMKQFSYVLYANDLELYSYVTNSCYLTNNDQFDHLTYEIYWHKLQRIIHDQGLKEGLIRSLYSPIDENNITANDRVFYTVRNAMYIDTVRSFIEEIPETMKKYFLAPLIAEASVHSNTSGVFKGFYKDANTGIGKYGGTQENALTRILGDIELKRPVFSNFRCDCVCFKEDANTLVPRIDEVDLAYIDPPYNQHPYGSNYFMLNLIVDYKEPQELSKVSGIPKNWNKSLYNQKQSSYVAFKQLVEDIRAKYVLISFNSEGFISLDSMRELLMSIGKLTVLETKYNTFRGCRNLHNREKHVKEYLYLLEKI
ncbi:MAG: DNA adenine methylase [Candidatus Cloacimonetes bacterium]|nr:DNA adenine methylase [Candidatus Cloacimonadota bacterium]MCK9333473.1 DNA adenine methylase [Candidatus Cloacimonadota bacterium]MDD4035316.1 DNA adenine methylase [Candidatus Cloacimonadota bacterium]